MLGGMYISTINAATRVVVEGLNDQEKSDIVDIVIDRFNEEDSIFILEKEEYLDDTLMMVINPGLKFMKPEFAMTDIIDAIDTEMMAETLQTIADYFEEIDTLDIDDIAEGKIKVNWTE